MSDREKIDAAVAELAARGVGKSIAAPPLHRLLWALGVHVPPPHFQRFLSLAGCLFLTFGPLFSLSLMAVYIFVEPGSRRPSWFADHAAVALTSGTLAGLALGVAMAGFYRLYARQLGLPRWADYIPTDAEPEPDW